MSLPAWIWTHVSFVLLFTNLIGAILPRACSRRVVAALIMIMSLISITSVYVTDVSGFMLAHMGFLSTSIGLLMVFEFLCRWKIVNGLPSAEFRRLNLIWIVAGLTLYPSACGFVAFDVYGIGYSFQLPWAVLIVAGLAMWKQQSLFALSLTSAVLMHHFRWLESSNLWDYLIDPWLWLSSFLYFLKGEIAKRRSAKVSASAPKVAQSSPTGH